MLLLLDEPTAGMSPEETDETMRLIRELAAGRTVILVEHKMKVVMKISDRITVLHQGQVLADGHPRRDPRQHARAADVPGRRAQMVAALLALEDVHTYYGEAHILQGVSLTVGEGEVVTLIGRNGAGKTTTLRSIMGIVRPRRGRIVACAAKTSPGCRRTRSRGAGIAWVPEERRVLPNLTVLENLRLGDAGRGPIDGEVARSAGRGSLRITSRGLRERHRLIAGGFLSGGEQQMLAIARGLVARPALMLVDEPTEGLAPLLVQSLTGILGAINRRGTTILLVEQALRGRAGAGAPCLRDRPGAHPVRGHAGRAPPRSDDPAAFPRRLKRPGSRKPPVAEPSGWVCRRRARASPARPRGIGGLPRPPRRP